MTIEEMANELNRIAYGFKGSTERSATRKRKLLSISRELTIHAKTIKEIVCTNSSTK